MEPSRDDPADDLRPEYDLRQLRGGVRGKYARKMAHGDGYEQTAGSLAHERNGTLTREEVVAFHKKMCDELQPKLRSCVLPIIACDGAVSGVVGTGTMFRVAGRSFLVTAHHVFVDATKKDYSISICDNQPNSPAILLLGHVAFDATYDIAVMELSPEVVAGMPHRKLLSVYETDRTNRRPAGGNYALFGFPSVHSTPEEALGVRVMPFTQIADRYTGPTNTFENYDPASHILIDANRSNGTRIDSGSWPLPDSLRGMSGCSIWQVYYPGLTPKFWTPDDAVIVGVQTGVYKNGTVIKGTRWSVVDRLLREAYPDLAGPLDLHIPMSGT